MAKWLAVLRQASEGCDYTIGCGVKTLELDGYPGDPLEALEAFKSEIYLDDEGRCVWMHESALRSVTLHRVVATVEVPIEEWDAEEDARAEAAELEAEEAEERRLLAKLQEKYGPDGGLKVEPEENVTEVGEREDHRHTLLTAPSWHGYTITFGDPTE